MTEETAAEVEDFWFSRRFRNESKALGALVVIGLKHKDDYPPPGSPAKTKPQAAPKAKKPKPIAK